MVDIARAFSPVVVFASGDARPQSSDRIRSASSKRISSASTHRTSRVSSAVSTIENDGDLTSVLYRQTSHEEKDLETALKAELTTPLTGIDILERINSKISKLDRALRSVEAPSDTQKNNSLIISERLRVNAIQNGKSRQQVQQFAGVLAIKSTFQDQITATVKSKETGGPIEQDPSTLLEIYQYPGHEEGRVTPLPFNVSLERQVMRHILSKEYVLSIQAPHVKSLIELYYSVPTKALILDVFWWIFLETYQNQPKIQKKLIDRASNSYVSLLMMDVDWRYRDKCFQIYPSLLAETVFACFKVSFPASIKQMPVDADAAGKALDEKKNAPIELDNNPNIPGKRMKELVNLEAFKNSISNVCQLWLGGIPAPPRQFEKWRSKIVQQEKITFVEPAPAPSSTTGATSLSNPVSSSLAASSSSAKANSKAGAGTESVLSGVHHVSFKRTKRTEPQDILEDMYKHTHDQLPDRRVLFEDYLFDLNGYSPLTEKFLRSSHMLKQAGTQLFIPHPQIRQLPSVSAETYDKEIERAARICRTVRAQRHKERAEQQAQRHRRMTTAPKQRATTSKTRSEHEQQKKRNSIYGQKAMSILSSELVSVSQLSFKSHRK